MPENLVNNNIPEEYPLDKILKELPRFKYKEVDVDTLGFYIRRAKDRIRELPESEKHSAILAGLDKAEDISTEIIKGKFRDEEKENKFYTAINLSLSSLKDISL